MFRIPRLMIILGILILTFQVTGSGSADAAVTKFSSKNFGSFAGESAKNGSLHFVRGGRRGSRNVKRNRNSNRNVNKNRNRNVNKNRNRNVNKNVNRNVNRNVNKNVNVNVNVRRRGYGWRGTRWGLVAFGVTMGAVIIVTVNSPPPPPHPLLCWTWGNSALTRGYWYYCTGP